MALHGTFCNVILYPDSTSYDTEWILNKYLPNQECDWAYILHDSDVDENGELKKPHYHLIVRWQTRHSITRFAREIGVKENDVDVKGTFVLGYKYLIHNTPNSKEKYQYDASRIVSSSDFSRYLKEKSDSDSNGIALMEEILAGEVHTIVELYYKAIEIGAWSEYRRGFSMYQEILKHVNVLTYTDSKKSFFGAWKEGEKQREENDYIGLERLSRNLFGDK